jgi:hypothetical protein
MYHMGTFKKKLSMDSAGGSGLEELGSPNINI